MSTRSVSAVTINVHEGNTMKPATKASVKCTRIHPPANTSFGLIQLFLHRNNSEKRNKNKNGSVLPSMNSGQHRMVIVKSLLPKFPGLVHTHTVQTQPDLPSSTLLEPGMVTCQLSYHMQAFHFQFYPYRIYMFYSGVLLCTLGFTIPCKLNFGLFRYP